jgi:toxin ParE1/3/4
MKRTIRRAKRVRQDIIDIYRHIHQQNPAAAEKVLDAIERSINSLIDMPGVGHYWNSPDPRLQAMRVVCVRPYRNYLIFFRVAPNHIEVFRVVHGMRELQPLIDEIELDFEE